MEINEVNTVYRTRFEWLAIALLLCAVGASAQSPRHAAQQPLFAGLINEVVTKGPLSQVPPHLSAVLGMASTEQPTAVKQAVMRDGDWMRTFNVRSDQHDDVVLMAYDTRTRATKAYLTGPSGKLRKAVSYQAGEAPTERKANEARNDFAAEKKFWVNLTQTAAPAPR